MIPPRRRLLLAAALLAALVGPAAAESVFNRGNGADPETLDPHRSTSVPASHVEFDLFEGLVVPDGKSGFLPGAAERWDISADGLTYVFHLRRDGKWSDGTPVTAQDFVFSWRRVLDPALASQYAFFLWPVLNAEEASLGKKPLDSIGVRAIDAYTFEVKLREPRPSFLESLKHHSTYAVSKTNVEKFGAAFAKPGNLVSNGAYMLAEAIPQTHVKVVRNPYFHAAKDVRIDSVYFHATDNIDAELKRYRAGELDWTYEVPLSQTRWVMENMADQYFVMPYLGTHFYAFNLTREPWKSNRDLRLALTLAIDRDILADKVFKQGEKATFALVPPLTANYQPQAPDWAGWTQAERVAKAKELFRKAGYGPGGKELPEIEIMHNTSEKHRKVAVAVGAMWRQALGVKVVIATQEMKVFFATRDEKTFRDIARHGWIGDVNDANNFLELLRSDIGKQNPSAYANPEIDRLLDAANASMDVAKRRSLMQQAERIALDDAAIIPLVTYATQHMISPRLKGWANDIMDYHPDRFLWLEDPR